MMLTTMDGMDGLEMEELVLVSEELEPYVLEVPARPRSRWISGGFCIGSYEASRGSSASPALRFSSSRGFGKWKPRGYHRGFWPFDHHHCAGSGARQWGAEPNRRRHSGAHHRLWKRGGLFSQANCHGRGVGFWVSAWISL